MQGLSALRPARAQLTCLQVQQPYNHPQRKSYIAPSVPAPPPSAAETGAVAVADAIVHRHLDALQSAHGQTAIGQDLKSTSPWIMQSGINQFVQSWSADQIAELHSLTTLPLDDKEPLLCALRRSVEAHWTLCMKEIESSTDYMLRQHIASDGCVLATVCPHCT